MVVWGEETENEPRPWPRNCITGHGHMYHACNVVPLQCQPTVLRACPIDGDAVEEKEGVDEVLSIILANIFYTEVVNNQRKSDWSCLVGK